MDKRSVEAKLLGELLKVSLTCIENMDNLEELKASFVQVDEEGEKLLNMIFNSEIGVLSEDMKCKRDELSEMDIFEVENELDVAYRKVNVNENKVYAFSDDTRREISNELVKKYQECLLNVNMIDIDSRNKNEVEIDFRFKYMDEIIKYMKNEYDISELNGIEFLEFCRELMEMNIPFRMDIMNRIFNGCNEYGVGWKSRCLIVNGNEYKTIYDYLKMKLKNIIFNDEYDRIEYTIDEKYEPIVQSLSKYIECDDDDYNDLIENLDRRMVNMFINNDIINMNGIDCFFFFLFSNVLKGTILFGQEYDYYLREWIGDYDMKLLYRASEHGYTAESFHEYCDAKGPTLVIIKSEGGWIFGGYTTQSWSGAGIYIMIWYLLIMNR